MLKQRTLKNSIRATGIGLHTGRKVYMTLRPAAENTGIVFRRVDLDPPVDVPGDARIVGETMLGTTLIKGETKVSTVEHLMAALAGLGIDNLYVDLSAPEVPIMDGSAEPFFQLIRTSGKKRQKGLKKVLRITKPISYTDGDKTISITPYNGFKITGEMQHPMMKGTTILGLEFKYTLDRTEYGVGTGDWAATAVVGDEVEITIPMELNHK